MNLSIQHTVQQARIHFKWIAPLLKVPTNNTENQKLIEITRELSTELKHHKNSELSILLDLIYHNIETYENKAYPIEPASPADVLSFLMEQHDLTQSDLPEIGTQSHVSKILNGERNLTKKQIAALSKRFGVSPAVFFADEN